MRLATRHIPVREQLTLIHVEPLLRLLIVVSATFKRRLLAAHFVVVCEVMRRYDRRPGSSRVRLHRRGVLALSHVGGRHKGLSEVVRVIRIIVLRVEPVAGVRVLITVWMLCSHVCVVGGLHCMSFVCISMSLSVELLVCHGIVTCLMNHGLLLREHGLCLIIVIIRYH